VVGDDESSPVRVRPVSDAWLGFLIVVVLVLDVLLIVAAKTGRPVWVRANAVFVIGVALSLMALIEVSR
jgi:uncharacterized protein (DUF983 family)